MGTIDVMKLHLFYVENQKTQFKEMTVAQTSVVDFLSLENKRERGKTTFVAE